MLVCGVELKSGWSKVRAGWTVEVYRLIWRKEEQSWRRLFRIFAWQFEPETLRREIKTTNRIDLTYDFLLLLLVEIAAQLESGGDVHRLVHAQIPVQLVVLHDVCGQLGELRQVTFVTIDRDGSGHSRNSATLTPH